MRQSRASVARLGVLVLLVLPSTTLGCGRPMGKVSGKVTKGGVPLPGGSVIYQSADGKVRLTGMIKPEDGTYTILNVPVGHGKFGIDNTRLQEQVRPGMDPIKMAGKYGPPDLPKPESLGNYVAIDPKYTDPNTSGLTRDIKRGENPGVDFDVK